MQNIILITIIVQILMTIVIFYISKKNIFSFLINKPSIEIRRFHKKNMIKPGGLLFLTTYTLIYINSIFISQLLLMGSLIMIVGFFSDVYDKFNASIRLFALFLVAGLYLLVSENYIYEVGIDFVDDIFVNNFLLIFCFSLLGLVLLINGMNIIDGLHGLQLGIMIIILLIFYYFVPYNIKDLKLFLEVIILSSLGLFFINFITGEIMSGDTGSYFSGFIVGSIAIYINELKILNAFHVACIIAYPIIELVFSYLRRISSKRNPFKPDQKHLHSIIYTLLLHKFKNIKFNENINRISSILIIIIYTLLQFCIAILPEYNLSYIVSLFCLVIFYSISYFYMQRKIGELNI